MGAYKHDVMYVEVVGKECMECGEHITLGHSALYHDFYRGKSSTKLVLCEYCAPVIVARLANDTVKMADYANLRLRASGHYTPDGCEKSKSTFQTQHLAYIESLLAKIKEVNKLEDAP